MSATWLSSDIAGTAAGGRKLIAVVYADMVGYSRLISLDDAGTLHRLRTLRRALIDPAIHEYGGKVVQTGGDSLLVAFDSIDGAVGCAVKVQQRVPVYDGDQPPDRRIRFRVGIDMGDAIPDGTDLHGDAVNIAARLEAASPVGGICVSRSVRDHVHGRLGLDFEPMGELNLKNIARPVEAFVLRLGDADAAAFSQPPATQAVGRLDRLKASRLSMVVLPFANRAGDSVADYLADGITEDLTAEMSRFSEFAVIDRSSAYNYKGRSIDIKRVGDELGVRCAVEGSVRKTAGGVLRINVQLVSTDTGTQLWADRFDVKDDRGYNIDNIVQPIAWALYGQIVNAESVFSTRHRHADSDAVDLVSRARAILNLPPTPALQAQTVGLFQRAVELDPSSATALSGLAETLLDSIYWESIVGWEDDPTVPAKLRKAEEVLTQAELLAPYDFKVMWTRQLLLGTQGRYAELIEAAQRTIEAHSISGGSHLWLGICLIRAGKAAEAIAEFEQSIRLHPRNPSIFNRYLNIGIALTFLERYNEAVQVLQRSLASHPNNSARNRGTIYALLAAAQALAGDIEVARVSAADASRLWLTLTVRAIYYSTKLFYGAQVSRICDGLRIAGVRDHVDEDVDAGIATDEVLYTDYDGPTPTTAPRARTILTQDLATLIQQHKPLILDPSGRGTSIPRAVGLWGAGIGGSLSDEFQDRLGRKMQQLTRGDTTLPVVAMGFNAERYQGRNLALRLVALGYTNVYWYRGGREAWEVAGLPETEVVMQDW